MSRRRRSESDNFIEGIATLLGLALFGGIWALYKKAIALSLNEKILIGVAIIFVISFILFLYYWFMNRKYGNFHDLVREIQEKKLDVIVNNFIERFGKEIRKKSESAWRYRDYAIDWKHIEDFRDELIQAGIKLSDKDYSEDESLDDQMEYVLKTFIDEKERKFVKERVQASVSHSFNELNTKGDDFEHLIVRLFEAMGFASKRIGGTGDQGGDVIAAKGSEQILIQAKCYTVPVGNDAVQQAAAARQFHKCTKAIVMATSTFTPEAIALARETSVELVDRKKLQQYFAKYLNESWQ
jgi:restriction endonuclease Mrr